MTSHTPPYSADRGNTFCSIKTRRATRLLDFLLLLYDPLRGSSSVTGSEFCGEERDWAIPDRVTATDALLLSPLAVNHTFPSGEEMTIQEMKRRHSLSAPIRQSRV